MVGLEAHLRKLDSLLRLLLVLLLLVLLLLLPICLRSSLASTLSSFQLLRHLKWRALQNQILVYLIKKTESSTMASASSSLSPVKRHDVFSSFHGPDVRKGFLSHLHTHFASKAITTFNDQEIVRGHTIGPELVQAIRESRVSIVVLSKKYASSSWCLDELVEILKCKEDQGQTVMTIFYEIDPSDVRKQTGEFGRVFGKTCEGKSEEKKQRWIKALADVATIAGEHSHN